MNQDILTDIIAHKRKEITIQEAAVSASFLENHIGGTTVTRSMKQSLTVSSTGIIAEFKRRSPSKGWINREADASIVPHNYELAGAAALSILTDELFFGGSLKDIRNARPTVNIPVLRKDFIISRYQLLQAKVAQADAVLLIAAALSKDEMYELGKRSTCITTGSITRNPYRTRNRLYKRICRHDRSKQPQPGNVSYRYGELLPPCREASQR